MEMKYLFINFPNTPRNIIKIIGETSAAGSVAYEENLALEDLIKPKDFYEKQLILHLQIIERENILRF